jgi:hypothetical protein
VAGTSHQLEAAGYPRPDEDMVQRLALRRGHDAVPVAVGDQDTAPLSCQASSWPQAGRILLASSPPVDMV